MLDQLTAAAGLLGIRRNDAVDARLARIEARLAAALTRAWERSAAEVIAAAVGVVAAEGVTAAELERVVKAAAGRELTEGLAARVVPAVVKAARFAVSTGGEISIVDPALKRPPPPKGPISPDVKPPPAPADLPKAAATEPPAPPDPEASINATRSGQWLASDTTYWVGKAGPEVEIDVVGPDGTTRKVPIGQHLADLALEARARGATPADLATSMRAALGGTVGERSDAYWRIVATNTVTRGAALGAIAAAESAGLISMRWVSVLDDRTTPICRYMNGRLIPLRRLQAMRDAAMSATTSDEMKAAWPWATAATTADLEPGALPPGVSAPPAHANCRSRLEPGERGPSLPAALPAPPAPRTPTSIPQGSFDHRDEDLFDARRVKAVRPGSLVGLTPVGANGLGVAFTFERGPLAGRKLAQWPTREPPKGGGWVWSPDIEHADGGQWRRSWRGARGVAVSGAEFRAWHRSLTQAAAAR